jgi:TRAP-type C4-dicarboxylate transport system substrate-binding protein
MKGKAAALVSAMLLVVGLSLMGLAAPAQAQKFNWRIQSNLNPGEPGHESVRTNFVELVEKMSNGEMKLQLLPVAAIFPVNQGLEAIGSGVTEMALLTGGYFSGKMGPIATMESGLPGAEHTPLERYNFFYKWGFLKLVREAYAKYNVYYLGPHISTEWDIISKKPIRSMADFKGLKIRTFGIEAEWYKAMGASPVFMGGGDIYTALATGVIDAARWGSPSVMKAASFDEVTKYYIQPSPMPAPNNFFAVNMDAWKALPDHFKAMLEEGAQSASQEYLSEGMMKDKKAANEMKAKGMQFVQIPPAEWAKMEKIVQGIWGKYGEKDPVYAARGVKMLQEYLAYLGR